MTHAQQVGALALMLAAALTAWTIRNYRRALAEAERELDEWLADNTATSWRRPPRSRYAITTDYIANRLVMQVAALVLVGVVGLLYA